MLEENKRIYEDYASSIPNWQEMDKSELCRKYIENETNPYMASAYFSAIVLSYWGKVKEPRYRQRMDAQNYDILIDAINKALKHRSWEREDSSIYNDPNGPDKAINRIFKHLKINELIKSKAQKYFADTSAKSLEELVEETNGYISLGEEDESNNICMSIDIEDFIKLNFDSKDYFMSFLVHIISYENCFTLDENMHRHLSIKKICKIIHHIDDVWCNSFSEKYGIDFDKVKKATQYFVGLKTEVLDKKINWYLRDLKYYGIFTRN